MKSNGSFGIPDELKQAIDSMEKKKTAPSQGVSDVEDLPIEDLRVEGSASKEDQQKDLTEKELKEKKRLEQKKLLEEIKEDLGIKISEDDIWSFLLNNEIIKKDIVIVPGRLHATFKTLTLDETNAIDSIMAQDLEVKRLENGFKNINTQHLLSRSILELGKPNAPRSIGSTPKERFDTLGKMSALLVEKLGRKWNLFVFLIDGIIKEEMEVKKD